MTIKLVTLKTNHTLLADVESVGDSYSLKEPVQVVTQPTKDGPMLAFVPFIEFADEFKTGIKIQRDDVLTVNTPVREVLNQYNQLFGSGLTIASAIPKV
jgi:hypothetical protein